MFVNLTHENNAAASFLGSRGIIPLSTNLIQVKHKFPANLSHDLVMQLVGLCINLIEKNEANRKCFLVTPRSVPKTRQKSRQKDMVEFSSKTPLQIILENFQELVPTFQDDEESPKNSLSSLSQVSV